MDSPVELLASAAPAGVIFPATWRICTSYSSFLHWCVFLASYHCKIMHNRIALAYCNYSHTPKQSYAHAQRMSATMSFSPLQKNAFNCFANISDFQAQAHTSAKLCMCTFARNVCRFSYHTTWHCKSQILNPKFLPILKEAKKWNDNQREEIELNWFVLPEQLMQLNLCISRPPWQAAAPAPIRWWWSSSSSSSSWRRRRWRLWRWLIGTGITLLTQLGTGTLSSFCRLRRTANTPDIIP